jgi:hypothetical protein
LITNSPIPAGHISFRLVFRAEDAA